MRKSASLVGLGSISFRMISGAVLLQEPQACLIYHNIPYSRLGSFLATFTMRLLRMPLVAIQV